MNLAKIFLQRLLIVGVAMMVSHAVQAQFQPGQNNNGGGSGTKRQYRSNTQVGDASIAIDPETRSLIITTDEQTNAEIAKVIKNLDKPKPQVLIKVLFLEVTYNKDLDVGVEGKYTFRNDGKGTIETILGLAQQTQGGFYRVLVDDWSVTLRALAQQGKLEVLSRPQILARNNQEAVITVGSEIPIVTNSRITDTGQTLNTIQYQDVGIILRVTPFITPEGSIEMIVSPEISTLTDQTIPISDTTSSPVIAKRSAETVVVTPNAKTVVIGGLMENKKTESVRKIPLLGDIPLLGHLFRRTIKDAVKTELLIFLTPTIVETPDKLAELSGKEFEKTDLTKKAFTADELDKNLDGLSTTPKDEPIQDSAAADNKPVMKLNPPTLKVDQPTKIEESNPEAPVEINRSR